MTTIRWIFEIPKEKLQTILAGRTEESVQTNMLEVLMTDAKDLARQARKVQLEKDIKEDIKDFNVIFKKTEIEEIER